MTDIEVTKQGSIVLVRPKTPEAEMWLRDHIDASAQWYGDALAVDPHVLENLVEEMEGFGLACSLL